MTERYYRYYGLTLSCNQPLPPLMPSAPARPDVSIAFLESGESVGPELPPASVDPSRIVRRVRTAGGTCLRVRYARADDWTDFVIDERGRNVRAARSENVVLEDVAELLIGQVFSCLLAQRQITCLHAAVVQMERRALALLGAAGVGKSMTALALLDRGGLLVSDDVAALRERNGRVTVSVGAARVRVRADAAELLVGAPAELDPVWACEPPSETKRYVQASNGSNPADERPLDVLYVLGSPVDGGGEPQIRPLTPANALPHLMANRHMVVALDRDAHRRDFERLGQLVETIPVRELTRPAGLETIPRTAAAIEADALAIG